MTKRLHVLLLAALFLLIRSSGAAAAPYHIAVSLEAFGNSIDGSQGPKCNALKEVEAGKPVEWWVAIGEARPDPQGGWAAVGNAIRCGLGAYQETSGASPRRPYLIAAVSTIVGVEASRLGPENVLQVVISLSLRKLSDLNPTGEPSYAQSTEQRRFFFSEPGTAFLPLIMADAKETEAFKLHEALIGITAKLDEKKRIAAAYGELAVASDLDGAAVFLDGGLVGNVTAGKELALKNVLAGDREVSVRDSSGREIRRVVRVEEHRTAMIGLKRPNPARDATRYRLVALGKNRKGFDEYRRQTDEAVAVRIPPGEFLMGNPKTERQPLEHRVYVSEFLMDKTAVTWGQFKTFARATGASLPPNPPYWGIHDDHPAVFVTWEEAKAHCEWAGARLPTEAEREKAARGTDGRTFPWGNEEPTPQRGVFRRNWGDIATDPVGAHPSGASPYDIMDAGGNVWEWVADWFDEKYYEVSPYRDPKGPRTGSAHVVRGGSWDSRPTVLSASARSSAYRGYREGDFGFRCAMDPVD